MAARRWGAVLVSRPQDLGHGLTDAYRPDETLSMTRSALRPVTGWPVRPREVFVPKD